MVMHSGDSAAETKFCASIGEIVVRWNELETMFRLILSRAVGSGGHRVDVLIANLGNVALNEALTAIADDWEDEAREHLIHCAKLFDAARTYRNHYVHNPILFGRAYDENENEDAVVITQSTTAKGGALRLHQGQIKQSELDAFLANLCAIRTYLGGVVSALYDVPKAPPLSSLERPPLPAKLALNRLRLIERKRQLRDLLA